MKAIREQILEFLKARGGKMSFTFFEDGSSAITWTPELVQFGAHKFQNNNYSGMGQDLRDLIKDNTIDPTIEKDEVKF